MFFVFEVLVVLKKVSGPEIVDRWGLSGPALPPRNPLGKVGGHRPPPSPVGFVVGGSVFGLQHFAISGQEALMCKVL